MSIQSPGEEISEKPGEKRRVDNFQFASENGLPAKTVKSIYSRASQRIKKILGLVTLEPVLFLKMLAECNLKVVRDTLEIDRVCRINLNFTEEECIEMDYGNRTEVQAAVQVYRNTFSYYQSLMDSILPVIVVLFAGSISDRYGRKLPMATVLAGLVVFALICVATALNPTWPVEVLYAATFAVDITGSWVVFNMAVYSYLADITPTETRTKRMGWMDAVWCLGGPIGTLFGGWLYRSYGYVPVFSVSAILWLISFIYIIFVVKESIVKTPTTPKIKPFDYITDLGQAVFRSYPHRGRIHLLSLMAIKLGTLLTRGHQVYLWARRVLGWDATQFSIWSGADEAVHQAGMVIWVALASCCHLMDHTLAIFGLISIGLWSLVLACITGPSEWWLVIVASIVGCLKTCFDPALRSLITSIPDKKDIGKILASLGLLESIWLIVGRSVYTFLYNAFVEPFPQINYVIQSGVSAVLVFVLWGLKIDWIKQRK